MSIPRRRSCIEENSYANCGASWFLAVKRVGVEAARMERLWKAKGTCEEVVEGMKLCRNKQVIEYGFRTKSRDFT